MTSLARSDSQLSPKTGQPCLKQRRGDPILPANPRPQRRDCQGQLVAALEIMAGPGATMEDASLRPWCSATFVGAQHRMRLRVEGPDAAGRAQAFADGLPDAAFTLRGHVVVDAAVDSLAIAEEGAAVLALAVLTIEDW